jgi:NADH dehydrogenase
VHARAPAALARACTQLGVRLVHISALGLHDGARSRFLTSKLAGERAVAASGADCCIVRPSLLDGEGGFGARWLRRVARWPLHCVPAGASGRIAALAVGDLAEAIAAVCELPRLRYREVELGGTAAYTMAEYLTVLRGAPALCITVPAWLARLASHAMDVLHFSPFSYGHLELMGRDNLPCPNRLPELLGRAPAVVGRAKPRRRNPPAPRGAGGRASSAGP